MAYEGYKNLKVHFVGSIAFYYSDLLRQAAVIKECRKEYSGDADRRIDVV